MNTNRKHDPRFDASAPVPPEYSVDIGSKRVTNCVIERRAEVRRTRASIGTWPAGRSRDAKSGDLLFQCGGHANHALDFRSVMERLGWAVGPMLPLVPKFIPWEAAREVITKMLG